MSDFYVLVVFNDRASTWVEIASSFDRSKVEGILRHLVTADVVAQVVACGADSDLAIAFVVDSLLPPSGSFAADMNEVEDMLVAEATVEGFSPPRRKRSA